MINEPIKITNLDTLRLEKQRLRIYCSFQEELVKDKIIFIKSNYKQIVVTEFLQNKTVSKLSEWVNGFVSDKFSKGDTEGKNGLSSSFMKIAETLIQRLFNQFSKK